VNQAIIIVMNAKEKIDHIANHLKEKYSPVAIILHGSRASGKSKPNSDWDFYVFVNEKVNGGTEVFEGENLDVSIQYLPIDDELIDTFGNTLLNAKILLDSPDGIAKKLIEEINLQYINGRKLTEREYLNRNNRMQRVLNRLKDNLKDDMIFFYHLGTFYEITIRYWFELKAEWTKPIYEALPHIKENDEEYFNLLADLVNSHKNESKIKSAVRIYDKLFKTGI